MIEIFVWYGVFNVSDLSVVSKKMLLFIEEIIELYISMIYKVYVVGFFLGFVYMGDILEVFKCVWLGILCKWVFKGVVVIVDR